MGLTTRLFASSFNPPDPPASQGDAVYPDIDFSYAGNEASQGHRRNHDEAAVFVINGASRGIGLQMAKSLVERTNVGYCDMVYKNNSGGRSPSLSFFVYLCWIGYGCGVL